MGRGGVRNRGPLAPDPTSEAALRRFRGATVLPREGYTGTPPKFPLPHATTRERAVWRDAWRTPQAVAWAQEPWRWRTVALWTRWTVRAEERDASAAVAAQCIRLADQIGLTPAGMTENRWRVEDSGVSERPGLHAVPSDGESSLERARRSSERSRSRFPTAPPPEDGA